MSFKFAPLYLAALIALSACTSDEPEMQEPVETEENAPETAAEPAAEKTETKPAVESTPVTTAEADNKAKTEADAKPAAAKPAETASAPAASQDQQTAAAPAVPVMYVTTTGLNVRSGPGMDRPVVRVLGFRDQVKAFDREGIWVMIGQNQYASSVYLSPASPATPNDPVAVEKQQPEQPVSGAAREVEDLSEQSKNQTDEQAAAPAASESQDADKAVEDLRKQVVESAQKSDASKEM